MTLLNREYFGENRSFMIKKATFDHEHLSNGNGSFIKIADLLTHRPRFTDSNGEFQVKNTKTASAALPPNYRSMVTLFRNKRFMLDEMT